MTQQLATSGTIIDERYRLEEHLGEGSFAQVFRATDLTLQRQVALKILRTSLSDDAIIRTRAMREAQVIMNVRHPNIVRLYDAQLDRRNPWIVLELVKGIELEDLIFERPFSIKEALWISTQLASALEHLHDREILHRDVKPGNVIVESRLQVKLMDFNLGCAPGMTAVTATDAVMGTPRYLAPEMWFGADASGQSDLYALGLILHDLLTGGALWSPSVDFQTQKATPVPLPSNFDATIPQAVDDLVEWLTRPDPDERCPSAHSCRRMIEQLRKSAPNRLNHPLHEPDDGTSAEDSGTISVVTTPTPASGIHGRQILLATTILLLIVLGSALLIDRQQVRPASDIPETISHTFETEKVEEGTLVRLMTPPSFRGRLRVVDLSTTAQEQSMWEHEVSGDDKDLIVPFATYWRSGARLEILQDDQSTDPHQSTVFETLLPRFDLEKHMETLREIRRKRVFKKFLEWERVHRTDANSRFAAWARGWQERLAPLLLHERAIFDLPDLPLDDGWELLRKLSYLTSLDAVVVSHGGEPLFRGNHRNSSWAQVNISLTPETVRPTPSPTTRLILGPKTQILRAAWPGPAELTHAEVIDVLNPYPHTIELPLPPMKTWNPDEQFFLIDLWVKIPFSRNILKITIDDTVEIPLVYVSKELESSTHVRLALRRDAFSENSTLQVTFKTLSFVGAIDRAFVRGMTFSPVVAE